ncbi:MAG: RHS repeat-associated core domain-containing protein, partial [Flavobacteriaceae bacterium]
GITYDKNGNIETLKREGWTSASPSLANNTGFGTMDDLVYDYDSGNKLTNVADNNASDSYGFVDVNGSGTEYTYDANGNMTRDDNKGITSITYNHLNLPQQVSFGGNNIQYVYAADGTKLKKTVSTTGTETLYAGGYLYEGNTLQFFPHPEGYVSVENGSYKYVYEFKDHLSNTRLSYTDADDNGNIAQNEIIKESNYFPFGLAHRGYNGGISPLGNSVAKKYMFGGKEYQDELDLGWYDVSARNYDPALGRWMNLDPLTEQMRRHSPYNYAFDNPVFFIDPDGMKPCPNGDCENGFLAALRGYYKGARNAVQKRVDAVVGFVSDPVGSIETAVENTPSTFEEAAEATVTQIVGDTSIGDLALTTLDIVQGAQENGIEGAVEAAAENLADRSIDAALALTPIKMKTKTAAPKTTKNAPVTNQLYKRPNNATTPAQRASVQNKPCVDCGGTSPTMRADHKTPLVEEHYTTGTINKTKMRSTEAVQPQCETCSNSQGGKMSAYSKQMKKIIEERTKNQ